MVKPRPNTYYKGTKLNFILYVGKDNQVGFGFDMEQAKETCGSHNHWLKGSNFHNPEILTYMTNPILENK